MDWIGLYLQEDLGEAPSVAGDLTSQALVQGEGEAWVVMREAGTVCGLPHAVEVFRRLGADAEPQVGEGAEVAAGVAVLHVQGPAQAILAGERVALNILGRMSGIATEVRRLNARLAATGSSCVVAGTRKTTPGFRAFEKEAIATAGGDPHRDGLWDALMVKDNHLAALAASQGTPQADVGAAVAGLRSRHPGLLVEVEVESLDDAMAAAAAGTDWILIDNQPPDVGRSWAAEVRAKHPGTRIEASGGIHPDAIEEYAWADRVSLGRLTSAARSLDLGLDWTTTGGGR